MHKVPLGALMDAKPTETINEFLRCVEEAKAMVVAGEIGSRLDSLLIDAQRLLDIVDEKLLELDRQQHREVFEIAATLHDKLHRLRMRSVHRSAAD